MAVSKPVNKPLARPAPIPVPKAAKKKEVKPLDTLFTRDNYMWMAIGAVIIAIGMFLMSGGKNQDPNTFNTDVVYSTTRITVAPILIVLGLLVEVYAIFKKSKKAVTE
ncbi:MAG TPA: DUF3098 domain-containing protein [Chitinophagaceae bacterium]|jgi:hypothetical protein|nr:DUF3098 domain-containing protein [Chitinophagaceae bacterium]